MSKKADFDKHSRVLISYNAVAELEGIDAELFLKYDNRDLTENETHSIQDAHDLYKRHCKL